MVNDFIPLLHNLETRQYFAIIFVLNQYTYIKKYFELDVSAGDPLNVQVLNF